jgi:hypothetical protein
MEAVEWPASLARTSETDTAQLVIQSAIAQLAKQDTKEPSATTAKPVSILMEPSVFRVEV